MSQFKRYLNIINELKVPEMGLKNAKKPFNILNSKFNKLFGQKDYESRLKLPDGNFKQLWVHYFKNDKHPFEIKEINIDDNFENFLKKYSIIRSSKDDEKFLTFLDKIFSTLKDLKLDPTDLSQDQNKEVFNAYFNYKHHKEIPKWTEIRSAMTGSIASYIKREKLDRQVIKDLLKMLKESVEKSGYVTERTTVKNDAIDDLEVEDYIKTPSIIHKIVNGKVVDGKIVDDNNKIIIDKN